MLGTRAVLKLFLIRVSWKTSRDLHPNCAKALSEGALLELELFDALDDSSPSVVALTTCLAVPLLNRSSRHQLKHLLCRDSKYLAIQEGQESDSSWDSQFPVQQHFAVEAFESLVASIWNQEWPDWDNKQFPEIIWDEKFTRKKTQHRKTKLKSFCIQKGKKKRKKIRDNHTLIANFMRWTCEGML